MKFRNVKKRRKFYLQHLFCEHSSIYKHLFDPDDKDLLELCTKNDKNGQKNIHKKQMKRNSEVLF